MIDPRKLGADCDRCPLNGAVPVPFDPGVKKVKLIVVGEAPGNYETTVGRVFVGPSGKLLDRRLEEGGLLRSEVHVTNAMMCLLHNDTEVVKQRAVACCAPRLQRELAEVDPSKKLPVLTVGKWAAYSLLGIRKIVAHRGFVWRAPEVTRTRLRAAERSREKARAASSKERTQDRVNLLTAMASYEGRTIVPSIHPAFVLRSETWSPLLKLDVIRACKIAKGEFVDLLDEGAYTTLTSNDPKALLKALSVLREVASVDIESKPCDADIAAKRKYPDPTTCKILCVGVSDASPDRPRSEWHSFVIHPKAWGKVHGKVLAELYRTRTAVFHNGKAFDEIALARFGAVFPQSEDTLIAHHTFAGHLPQGLAHVASVFAPFCGPWKANHQAGGALAERGTSPWESDGEELDRYCAADVRIDSYAWHAMQPDLARERAVYERDMAVADLCQEMQVSGLGVDIEHRRALSNHLRKRAAAILGEIRSLVRDRDFNPARATDMRRALFGRFKAPLFKLTASGFRSTGAEVLEALRGSSSTNYGRLADLCLRWRGAMKADATFLRAPLGRDGRVHASWRAFGTESGRPACVARGTLIETMRDVRAFPKGIPVEDVRAGDMVYCYVKGKPALRRVTAHVHTGKKPVVRVHWRGTGNKHTGYVDLTADHLVLCVDKSWVAAGALRPGDRVMAMSRDVARGYARLYFTGQKAPVREHRFVWAQHMKGPLPAHVHHENENRLDNRISNLAGMTNSDHQKLHGANISDERRAKYSEVSRRRYAEGTLGIRGWKKEEHPRWLGLTREEIDSALRANSWSVTKTARALGHDFDCFKRHVERVGFALAELKLLARSKPRGKYKLRKQLLNNHAVIEVEPLDDAIDVYDLTVDEAENFIAGEICIHNCRNPNLNAVSRYAAVTCRQCFKSFPDELAKCPLCGGGVRIAYDQHIRDVYVSEADKGTVFVYYDLKQAEMWAAAMLSEDSTFIETCRGGDIHSGNAAILFPEQAHMIKAEPKGAGKVYRDIAKNAGFAVTYGAGYETVYKYLRSQGFPVDLHQVQVMLDRMAQKYRRYYQYCNENIAFAGQHGYLRTRYLGRIRWFGRFAPPTEIQNFPIQAFVSDIMGERLLEIHARQPKSARMVMYIYDAGIWRVKAGRDADRLLQVIKEVWEREIVIPDGGQRWVQPIDLKVGERWSEL